MPLRVSLIVGIPPSHYLCRRRRSRLHSCPIETTPPLPLPLPSSPFSPLCALPLWLPTIAGATDLIVSYPGLFYASLVRLHWPALSFVLSDQFALLPPLFRTTRLLYTPWHCSRLGGLNSTSRSGQPRYQFMVTSRPRLSPTCTTHFKKGKQRKFLHTKVPVKSDDISAILRTDLPWMKDLRVVRQQFNHAPPAITRYGSSPRFLSHSVNKDKVRCYP